MPEIERTRNKNYISEYTGREVYYRTSNQVALSKKQGHFGCGKEGWTCSFCSKSEYSCVCNHKEQASA